MTFPDTESREHLAGERVLLQADATVEVNELLSAMGEVTVTTRRIRFQPNRMERLVGLGAAFEAANETITGFGFTGIRHRLEVHTSTQTTRFLGDVIPGLYAALQSNAEAMAGEVAPDAIDFRVWPASLCRGPVRHPGALVHTATRVAFVATGLLDSLVGVHSLSETPLAAITSIELVGRLEQRIELNAGSSKTTVVCADVVDRYEHLIAWWAARAAGPVWLGPDAPSGPRLAEFEAFMAPWRGVYALPEGLRLFTPAIGLSQNSPATPGWLLVGADAMVWLPRPVVNSSRPPVSLPLGRERWMWDDHAEEVRVDRDGTPYRWVTKAGKPFRLALFDVVERIQQRIALAWASSGTGVVADGQNRRDSYRVQVVDQSQTGISIWMAAEGDFRPLTCKLLELSLGGCSIRMAGQLPANLLVRVDLFENGRTHSVRASVAYARQRMHDQRWVAGLVFVEPPSDFDTALRHLWMSLQQQQLRRLRGADGG